MPGADDVVLSNLEARVGPGDPVSGAVLEILVHNVTDAEIPAHALTIAFFAAATSGQTQESATESFYVGAVAANEMHKTGGPIHLDPGDWSVTASLFDSESTEPLAHHEAIPVHVPGYVHHAAAFDGSVQYDIGVQIQWIEHMPATIYRVHYELANHGTTTVPPGMLVRAMIVENDDTLAWQDYHFEQPCPPGPPDAKYLTLEGSSTFTDALVYVTADPGGPSERTDAVRATTGADGRVELSR